MLFLQLWEFGRAQWISPGRALKWNYPQRQMQTLRCLEVCYEISSWCAAGWKVWMKWRVFPLQVWKSLQAWVKSSESQNTLKTSLQDQIRNNVSSQKCFLNFLQIHLLQGSTHYFFAKKKTERYQTNIVPTVWMMVCGHWGHFWHLPLFSTKSTQFSVLILSTYY